MATPNESHTRQYSHINASPADLLDRFAVSELCKGWSVYRDNSEWMNYRSLFTADATVWTSMVPHSSVQPSCSASNSSIAWSGARHIDDFIAISKEGKAKGVSILHRENGTLVELNSDYGRAVGKMKATITQRFTDKCPQTGDTFKYDVDCDCRFLFFCMRTANQCDTWKVQYTKLIYEKDKVIPVDGKSVPDFNQEELQKYPEGYQYLGAAQARLGYNVDPELVTFDDRYWRKMYECMERWLEGDDDPGLFWDGKGKPDLTA
ncbi:Fc.00g005400.m01.CDS01 [Cosmosporella sp. VM-42]